MKPTRVLGIIGFMYAHLSFPAYATDRDDFYISVQDNKVKFLPVSPCHEEDRNNQIIHLSTQPTLADSVEKHMTKPILYIGGGVFLFGAIGLIENGVHIFNNEILPMMTLAQSLTMTEFGIGIVGGGMFLWGVSRLGVGLFKSISYCCARK